MAGKCFQVDSRFVVVFILLQVAVSIDSQGCPPGQYYFNNSTNQVSTDSDVTTYQTPGANCYNCSSSILMCDHCYYNRTTTRVVCLNCTDGWRTTADGVACLREETPQGSSFPWWGGLLIVLAIIGVVAGAIAGFHWWKNKEEDLPGVLPDPDFQVSIKTKNERKKNKTNSYIGDPSRSANRIPASIYGQTQTPEGSFVNDEFVEIKDNTEPRAAQTVNPGAHGSQEQGPIYENFSGKEKKGPSKLTSQYPMDEINTEQDIYMNT